MKKICMTLLFLLMMSVQQGRAREDLPLPKSECQKLLESCRPASLNLATSESTSKDSLCRRCQEKCNKNALQVCAKEAKANPKENANFESIKVHYLHCKNVCRTPS